MYVKHGFPLPAHWQYEFPVRWVLDPTSDVHCEACIAFAGEYESWGKLVAKTQGSQPGYFPTCAEFGKYSVRGKGLIACGKRCNCEVEINIGGEWIRLESPFRGRNGLQGY